MFEILINFFMISAVLEGITSTNDCGDWMPFKDEKCFKVFEKMVKESTAEDVCSQKGNESVLAIIESSEEQQFIDKYLKTINTADNVWIGIKKINNAFKYLNGNEIEYNNWAKDRPLKNSNLSNCVVMSVHESNEGKWLDERCEKKNAILCEKVQPWSVNRLQNILLETRRDHKVMIDQMTKLIMVQHQQLDASSIAQNEKIDQLRRDQNNLELYSVPIGFIYAQFSGQSDPNILWPNTEWENISEEYSGLFFRAEGELSSVFGAIQEQQTQSIEIFNDFCNERDTWNEWKTIKNEPFEKFIKTGFGDRGAANGIKMKHNNEEIRPRNQAIRIWRRIK